MHRMEETKGIVKYRKFILVTLILLTLAAVTTAVFLACGVEPSGLDVWGHVYKSDVMYQSLKKGILYPLYDRRWYNGIQIYRYWPPLTYYVEAFFEFLTGGNVIHAYAIFAGFVVFVGGFPFLLFGLSLKREWMGLLAAVFWFVLPDNVRVFFVEGNMPRIMTSVVIPYVLYFVWRYVRRKDKHAAVGIILSMMIMTFTHLMITAIVGIGTFLYLLFDWFETKETKRSFKALVAMVIGILCAGIWFVPALYGGMLSMSDSSSDTQELLTFHLTQSLNPANRFYSDRVEIYYFGIGVLALIVIGALLTRGHRAGFYTALLVLLGTTPATVSVTKHLPLGNFLWMTRFTAFAYACLLISLLEWTTLKPKYGLCFYGILAIDCALSVAMFSNYYIPAQPEAVTDVALLKEYTSQRAAILDRSLYGCYPSWGVVMGPDAVDYTYGWAWQGASTAENIMQVNESLEKHEYAYMFDRCTELGDDAVLLKRDEVPKEYFDEMMEEAEKQGFTVMAETDTGIVFKKNAPAQFGTLTEYRGLAIGSYSHPIAINYPEFAVGTSVYVDDYTLEELTAYHTVFLSGFRYHNREAAETLLRRAGAAGVRVVIDSANFPEDGRKERRFMGMRAAEIGFEKRFPSLVHGDTVCIPGDIPATEKKWKTSYVEELDNVYGYSIVGGREIPYYGSRSSEPGIYYIGFGIPYLAEEIDHDDLWDIMDEVFDLRHGQTPLRQLIPITVTWDDKGVTIESPTDGVNTTIAYQDNGVSDREVSSYNHLLVVNEGTTRIDFVYPHKWAAIIVSLFGLAAAVWFCLSKDAS